MPTHYEDVSVPLQLRSSLNIPPPKILKFLLRSALTQHRWRREVEEVISCRFKRRYLLCVVTFHPDVLSVVCLTQVLVSSLVSSNKEIIFIFAAV